MEKKKWGAGAIIWFILMIIAQWIMFIEYITKPATATNSALQKAALIYGIAGAIGTALYLWLWIGKKKAALITIIVLNVISVVITLINGGGVSSVLGLISPLITFLVSRKVLDEPTNDINNDCKKTQAEIASSGPEGESEELEKLTIKASQEGAETVPAFLRYPYDPIASKMFEPYMVYVRNQHCGYRFKLYTVAADSTPEVREKTPPWDIHECHVYWEKDCPFWYSVVTMKSPSVKTSNLRNWVETGHMFGVMEQELNLPSGWSRETFSDVRLNYLGRNEAYEKLHDFEESHAYCYVFRLNGQIYKKFILCARKEEYSWKAECTIPSEYEEIREPDFVPPALMFGSFFPII